MSRDNEDKEVVKTTYTFILCVCVFLGLIGGGPIGAIIGFAVGTFLCYILSAGGFN